MKIQLTLTCVHEYEINPEHYPESWTDEQKLQADIKDVSENAEDFIEQANKSEITVTGQLLP